jgi:hypothetical protein
MPTSLAWAMFAARVIRQPTSRWLVRLISPSLLLLLSPPRRVPHPQRPPCLQRRRFRVLQQPRQPSLPLQLSQLLQDLSPPLHQRHLLPLQLRRCPQLLLPRPLPRSLQCLPHPRPCPQPHRQFRLRPQRRPHRPQHR